MKIKPFLLERYFAKYEFCAPILLSCSDAEPYSLSELMQLADEETRMLWQELSLGYTESQGHPLLREEIASLYPHKRADQIITIVPEEGIFLAMQVLLESGGHVITTFPGYQSLYEIANALGSQVSKWQPNADTLQFDVGELQKLVRKNTKLIVINFPHNPTGALITQEQLEQVLSIARENNLYVFADEMYRYLEFDQADRLPSVCEQYENSIVLGGMSKSFALAGLRSGWLVTNRSDMLEKVKERKDYTTICGSAPSEILALIGLRAKETIIQRNRAIIDTNLAVLDNFFIQYQNMFDWQKPKAGTVAFPRLTAPMPIDDFCRRLMEEKGVMLLPASVFDYPANRFRFGFGRSAFAQGLQHLEAFINQTLKR